MMNKEGGSIIRRNTLAEELAQRLSERIVGGEFPVGERLPAESELMRMFGVGRSTVREAVKILSDRGLVKVRQGAGTFVERTMVAGGAIEQRLQRADGRDLDEVRRILEVAVVRFAAERHTKDDMRHIERRLVSRGEAAATGDLGACIEADIALHVAIAEAAHNEILSELYRAAALRLQERLVRIYDDTACLRASQPSHERLVRCIAAGKAVEAQETVAVILDEP